MEDRIGFLVFCTLIYSLLAFTVGVLVFGLSLPVWAVWNTLMVFVFGFPPITFLQTMGLNFIIGTLFFFYNHVVKLRTDI